MLEVVASQVPEIAYHLQSLESPFPSSQLQAMAGLDQIIQCTEISCPKELVDKFYQLASDFDNQNKLRKAAVLFLIRNVNYGDQRILNLIVDNIVSPENSVEFKIQMFDSLQFSRTIYSPELLQAIVECISPNNNIILANRCLAHVDNCIGFLADEQKIIEMLKELKKPSVILETIEQVQTFHSYKDCQNRVINALRSALGMSDDWQSSKSTILPLIKRDAAQAQVLEAAISSSQISAFDLLATFLQGNSPLVFIAPCGVQDFKDLIKDLKLLSEDNLCKTLAIPLSSSCEQILLKYMESPDSISIDLLASWGQNLTGTALIQWGSIEGLNTLKYLSELSKHFKLIFYGPSDPNLDEAPITQRSFGEIYHDRRAEILSNYLLRHSEQHEKLLVLGSIDDCVKTPQMGDVEYLRSLMSDIAGRLGKSQTDFPAILDIYPGCINDELSEECPFGMRILALACKKIHLARNVGFQLDNSLGLLPFSENPKISFEGLFDGIILRKEEGGNDGNEDLEDPTPTPSPARKLALV